jgi:hypothetical protein
VIKEINTGKLAAKLQKICSTKEFPPFQEEKVLKSDLLLMVFNSNVQAGIALKTLLSFQIQCEVLHDIIFDMKESKNQTFSF